MPSDNQVAGPEQPDIDEALPDRRPRPIEKRPKASARTRLKQLLINEWGFDQDSAIASVRAVDDPDQALAQLKAPAEIGVHGGLLRVINVRIRNGAVLPLPTNPRVSSKITFPAGGDATPAGGMDPLSMSQTKAGIPGVALIAPTRPSLRNAMRIAAEYVLGTNDLRESVQSQGVLLPVTLVPVTFTFDDGAPAATGLCTIDGSSRMTAAMDAWNLTSEEVLFDLSDDAALTARRAAVTKLMDEDVATLSRDQLASLRNQSLPANLIVGYEAYEEGLDYTALLDAYLGLLHVEPPKPWGDAAGQDKRADAVLDELERLDRISPVRRQYLAGMLTPVEAEARGFDPSLDGRAAAIFYDLDQTRNTRAVNRALRRIGLRKPERSDRLEVATELAMRPYRRVVNEVVRRNPRVALPAAMLRLKPDGHWAPTLSSPDELLAKAVEESTNSEAGASTNELAVRAAFWLTRYNALQKSSRTDARFADQLLEHICETGPGLAQLAAVIRDGRDDEHPRQVRDDGTVAISANGQPLLVDDTWLRRTFPEPEAEDGDEEHASSHEDATDPWTPLDELRSRIYAIRDDVHTLSAKIRSLDEVADGEQKVVNTEGIAKDIGDEIKELLEFARDRVTVLKSIWEHNNDSGVDS